MSRIAPPQTTDYSFLSRQFNDIRLAFRYFKAVHQLPLSFQQGFGIPGSCGNVRMAQGCLQGNQITAFKRETGTGENLAKIWQKEKRGTVRANVQVLIALFTLCFFMFQIILSEQRIEKGIGFEKNKNRGRCVQTSKLVDVVIQ
jgi:hypothetical protein